MAVRLSLHQLFNEISDLINHKDQVLSELNHSAYTFFRKIILFRERDLPTESKELEKLSNHMKGFYESMKTRIPETIRKINADKEISPESKASHKTLILSTKGSNELLGLLEAIAIEITRDESYETNNNIQDELKRFIENIKSLSKDTRDFILMLQKGVDELPPAALYTVEGHLIGVALIMVYAFTISFNLSFLRLTQPSYESHLNQDEDWDYWTDIFLPLFGIPGYIILHYLSTRISMKFSFMVSIILLIAGNILYYIAYHYESIWFYLVGKAIIVSRLPLYGVKQFIGFNVVPKDRVKLSTCSVAACFLGYSCGYFLSLSSKGYEGSFLIFETNSLNIGGLFIGGFWVIICCFCSVLFKNPDTNYRSLGHEKIPVQILAIFSYLLPFAVMQAFVSNHAMPRFKHEWSEEKYFTFFGVFCLIALPVHLIIYISSYFTSDKALIMAYKVICITAGGLQIVMNNSEFSKEYWYVVSSILVTIAVNIGIAIGFTVLAGNIKNHRIGLFAGVLELMGIVLGNWGVSTSKNNYDGYAQITIITLVVLTFFLDILKYEEFDPLKAKFVKEPAKNS